MVSMPPITASAVTASPSVTVSESMRPLVSALIVISVASKRPFASAGGSLQAASTTTLVIRASARAEWMRCDMAVMESGGRAW
jgi:hypothetical protein